MDQIEIAGVWDVVGSAAMYRKRCWLGGVFLDACLRIVDETHCLSLRCTRVSPAIKLSEASSQKSGVSCVIQFLGSTAGCPSVILKDQDAM